MKKYLVFLLLLLSFASLPGGAQVRHTNKKAVQKTVEKVYVCVSPSAYAYHRDYNCRGLQRCKHEIKEETKQQAVEQGYRACKICY